MGYRCFLTQGMFKGGASDLLNFYPVFREIVSSALKLRGGGALKDELASLVALCNVLDGFCCLQQGHAAPDWDSAVDVWFESFLQAYPDQNPKPKHHFALHLPEQYAREQMLLTCFCLERKHKSYKTYAAAVTQLGKFEHSVTLQLLNEQIRELKDGGSLQASVRLVAPAEHKGRLATLVGATSKLEVARLVKHNKQTTGVGDMVFGKVGNEVAEVRLCLHVSPAPPRSSGYFALVTPYALAGGLYHAEESVALMRVEDIGGAGIWQDCSRGRAVIRPAFLSYVMG